MESAGELHVERRDCGLRLHGKVIGEEGRRQLREIFLKLHDELIRDRTSSCVVDVCELSFVNSSAIGALVEWIMKAEAASYEIQFLLNATITWQRINFTALAALAPDVVTLGGCTNTATESLEDG